MSPPLGDVLLTQDGFWVLLEGGADDGYRLLLETSDPAVPGGARPGVGVTGRTAGATGGTGRAAGATGGTGRAR